MKARISEGSGGRAENESENESKKIVPSICPYCRGLRGVVRDLLSLYLGYKIVKMWLFTEVISQDVGIVALLLFLLAIWFLLERIGIVPRITGE